MKNYIFLAIIFTLLIIAGFYFNKISQQKALENHLIQHFRKNDKHYYNMWDLAKKIRKETGCCFSWFETNEKLKGHTNSKYCQKICDDLESINNESVFKLIIESHKFGNIRQIYFDVGSFSIEYDIYPVASAPLFFSYWATSPRYFIECFENNTTVPKRIFKDSDSEHIKIVSKKAQCYLYYFWID